jgi:biotin carboxylase
MNSPPTKRDVPRSSPLSGRDVALLIGNYRPALAAARELSRLGWRAVLCCEPDSVGAEDSRYVERVWEMPALGGKSGDFRSWLTASFAAEPAIGLVMPITEATLNAVSAARDLVPAGVLLAMPSARVLDICHDKFAWLQFARETGVSCPSFAVADSIGDLKRVMDELGYPSVVRPVEAGKRIGKRKAISLYSAEDFDRELGEWPKGLRQLLVQRRFVGERYNIYFGAARGRIVREITSFSVRTDRHDGSGQTIEGVTVDAIPVLSEELGRIVAAMDYTGVGCAQFLYDRASGTCCFIEINPRFGASYAFIEWAGFELTRLAVELAGEDVPTEARPLPTRRSRFVWTQGDVAGLVFSVRQGDIGFGQALRWAATAFVAACRANAQIGFSWDDPKPALRVYLRRLRGGAKVAPRVPVASAPSVPPRGPAVTEAD